MKTTYYIGLFDKDTKMQRISTIEAYKIIENIALKFNEGASIFEGRGIYKHENGTTVIEPSLMLMINDEINNELIESLKNALNQESIMVESIKSDISFQ